MALTHLKVNTDRMKSDAEELRARLTSMKNHMDALSSAMETLLGYWDGPASETERQVYLAECENMKQLTQLLDGLLDEMERDCAAYNSCAQQVDGVVQALKV